MTREISHQKSFEKALYSIESNFPPGKFPGQPEYTDKCYNMSQGEGDMRGPWNQGDQWEYVSEREKQYAVDNGGGVASVQLSDEESERLRNEAKRNKSRTDSDPTTGSDLGAGPGAGKTKSVTA